jgi:CYTH domain-containing protein
MPVAELRDAVQEQIQQGYLMMEPDREVRIRRTGNKYFLTEKSGGGMIREEYAIVITAPMFEALWPLTGGNQLEKVRSTFFLKGQLMELDVYEGELRPLQLLEIEFALEEQARAWTPPWFTAEEVTGDDCYKNPRLARMENRDSD